MISDERKGIEAELTKRLGVAHQLCLVHLLRNAEVRVAALDWKAFLTDLHEVFWA